MNLVIRSYKDRRAGSAIAFPVVDSDGLIVIGERRIRANRRKTHYGLDDLKVILAKMASS